MAYNKLLESVRIGKWNLRSRIAMAPMTRGFADDKTGRVNEDMVAYYRRRAQDGIGLIITEGITPSPRGKGTFGVPGLYTKEQAKSWLKVTDAVHEEHGTIIAQLWHVGRLTHPDLTEGYAPQAPSAIQANGLVHKLRKPFSMPAAMTLNEIKEAVQQYAQAAQNAIKAGFDGVELHAAHGYLIDQFASEATNQRRDKYGAGSTGRLVFMKEILTAIGDRIGMDRIIVRFSELKDDQPGFRWQDPVAEIEQYLDVFREAGLHILHPSTNTFNQPIANGKTLHELVRRSWNGSIIGVGGLTPDHAADAILAGIIDLAAFGRPLLANPDFVQRLRTDQPLIPYEPAIHLNKLL